MLCKKCGSEIPDDVKFCPECGEPIELPEEDKQKEKQKEKETGEQEALSGEDTQGSGDKPEKSQKVLKGAVIITSVLALLVVGMCVGAYVYKDKNPVKKAGTFVAAPTAMPTETPAETPGETPAETPSETPAETPAEETPVSTETPTPTPTEAPVPTDAAEETVTPTPTATPAPEQSYILEDSNSRYYTRDELSSMSKEQLRLARNEIYARRGYTFKDINLFAYFSGKTWYQPSIEPEQFQDTALNEYEKANSLLIEQVETQ